MTFSTWEANTAHVYKLISIKTKNTTSQEKMKIEKIPFTIRITQ